MSDLFTDPVGNALDALLTKYGWVPHWHGDGEFRALLWRACNDLRDADDREADYFSRFDTAARGLMARWQEFADEAEVAEERRQESFALFKRLEREPPPRIIRIGERGPEL